MQWWNTIVGWIKAAISTLSWMLGFPHKQVSDAAEPEKVPDVVSSEPTTPVMVAPAAPPSEQERLWEIYNACDNPGVPWKVFVLRVTGFGWQTEAALEAGSTERMIEYKGVKYTPVQIYSSYPEPAVSYNAFYNRVVLRGWDVLRSLQTGVTGGEIASEND
jgi:hypothetical protein